MTDGEEQKVIVLNFVRKKIKFYPSNGSNFLLETHISTGKTPCVLKYLGKINQ